MQLNKSIFWSLLLLSFLARVVYLEKYPNSVNQDELSDMYDAHCIAETGADRHGHFLPTRCEGFGKGDNRPALLTWLMVIPQKITGFSVWSGRFTNALIGIASVFLFFFWISKLCTPALAKIGTILFALNPWLIWSSRIAHDGTILPVFFLVLFLFLMHKAIESNTIWWWIWTAFAIGFSVNAYNANSVIAPIWMGILLYQVIKKGNRKMFTLAIVIVACIFGALPKLVLMLNQPEMFAERAIEVRFNPHLTQPLYLLSDLWSYFNPGYLLKAYYNNLSVFRLTIAEYVLMITGIVILVFKSKKSPIKDFGYWAVLLLSILIPGLLFEENPQALRTSAFPVMAVIFALVGWSFLSNLLSGAKKKIFTLFIILLYVGHYAIYADQLIKKDELSYAGHKPQLILLGEKTGKYHSQYDSIYCIEFSPVNHLYMAAFGNISPREFQKIRNSSSGWYRANNERVLKMGKYIFTDDANIQRKYDSNTTAKNLYITDGYVLKGAHLFDSVQWRNMKFYYFKP